MANTQTKKKTDVLMLTVLGMLVAVTLVLGFTPIGYIKLGFIEITVLQIPVIIAAILYGKKGGTLLGAVFGITSFIQCFGMSAFGAAMLSVNPFMCAVTCIVPRTLMGFLTGLLFEFFSKHDKKQVWSLLAASLCAAVLNTILFMTTFLLGFWNAEFVQSMADGKNVLAFCVAFVGINGVVEAIVCALLGTAIGKAMLAAKNRLGRK